MDSAFDKLLYTKLAVPITRNALVPRSRLKLRFEQVLTRPLTLICAPAGAGKTTLITAWHQSADAAHIPLAWLSLDDDDNDLLQFAVYLAAALNTLVPGALDCIIPFTSLPQPPQPRVLATAVINQLRNHIDDFLLVLDDYHCIESGDAHQLVSFLIEHMPSQMHLVITSRADPPLPLARLRARDQLVEFRETDLRFTTTEAQTFFRDVFQLSLTDEQIVMLNARVEGWASGMKLAALALQGRSDAANFIQAFTGSHRFVLDYLMEEVFERQPESIQHFLLQTSILREMNAELCAAVTGRSDTQTMLERLVQLNLFTIPMDETNHWFRYHHLFADVLKHRQQRQSDSETQALYRLAAAWYVEQNQPQAALHYLFEGKAYADAANLIERYGFNFVENEGYETPLSWLRRMPADVLALFPETMLLAAFLYAKTNRTSSPEVRQWLDQAQAIIHERPGSEVLQARHDIVESILAQELNNDLECSKRLVEQAMPYVTHDTHWYINGAMHEAWVYMLSGEIDQALAIVNEIVSLADQHSLFNAMMEAYKVASITLQYAGRFGEALRVLKSATGKARSRRHAYHIELANVYFNISRIALLRCEFELAESSCRQTLSISEPSGVAALNIPAWLQLAEVQWFAGNQHEARGSIAKARLLMDENPEINHQIEQSTCAMLSMWLGDSDWARQWVHSTGFNPRPDESELAQYFEKMPWHLFHHQFLQVLMADLERHEQPLSGWDTVTRWADAAYERSQQRKSLLWQIRALVIGATAWYQCGQMENAYARLHDALTLAEPESVSYPFIICGAPVRSLLLKLRQAGQTTPFTEKLLAQYDLVTKAQSPTAPDVAQTPFEPLTEREREVLALVADGYSNSEIAQKLYLSVGTVKRHIANVFIKLGADSRTHALAIAREYGLL